MASRWWLLRFPNPHMRQYRHPRRETPSGVVVVHSAENTPDLRPPDNGAEAVAGFLSRRTTPGSYHALADSDSIVDVLPPDYEAWQDATGSNRHAWSVSGAFKAHQWTSLPEGWRDACVRNMAAAARWYADWLRANHGIVIPARRISRAASERREPGFISHGERDPARRSDPGPDFPWSLFLSYFSDTGRYGMVVMAHRGPDLDAVLYAHVHVAPVPGVITSDLGEAQAAAGRGERVIAVGAAADKLDGPSVIKVAGATRIETPTVVGRFAASGW